jgi:hypothetical protein
MMKQNEPARGHKAMRLRGPGEETVFAALIHAAAKLHGIGMGLCATGFRGLEVRVKRQACQDCAGDKVNYQSKYHQAESLLTESPSLCIANRVSIILPYWGGKNSKG